MSIFFKRLRPRPSLSSSPSLIIDKCNNRTQTTQNSSLQKFEEEEKPTDTDEFRVLNFTKKRTAFKKFVGHKNIVPPPRKLAMPVDQDWKSVWPGPRSFHPAVVPLPIRQGYMEIGKGLTSPGPEANAELMKIPNFLHLTPPAIRAHCEAIKKFCTPWPEGLETDEKCEEHFPLEVICSDYCHSGPRIRDPLSRIMSIRIPVSKIPLDKRSRDKFRRLVGDKYDPATDSLTITSDRCMMRKQNLDYIMYLLTAVYHESWNFEEWEKEKMEIDMEEYVWELNKARKSLAQYALWTVEKINPTEEEIDNFKPEDVKGGIKYKDAVCRIMDEGENEFTYRQYKEAVLELLNLKDPEIPISTDNRE